MSRIDFLLGDSLETLKSLPGGHFHCAVTSPPYFGLRDYKAEGQLGQEDTPQEFIARLVAICEEVKRVLRDDGVFWLNIGDSYALSRPEGKAKQNLAALAARYDPTVAGKGRKPNRQDDGQITKPARKIPPGARQKGLLLVPQRLAIALNDAGWIVRQINIWDKPNPMPESTKDRCTTAHEYVFMLVKKPAYFFDHLENQEPGVWPAGTKAAKGSAKRKATEGVNARPAEYKVYNGLRTRRSVWRVTTKPFAEAHYATYPPDLIEPAIRTSTSRKGCCAACGAPWRRIVSREGEQPTVAGSDLDRFGDGSHGVHRKVGGQYQKWLDENPLQTVGWKPGCECPETIDFDVVVPCRVLDPFGGAGTTGLVAQQLGLDATLCELNPDNIDMSKRRLGLISGCLEWDMHQAGEAISDLREALREFSYILTTEPF